MSRFPITIEEFREAYEKTGLYPVTMNFFVSRGYITKNGKFLTRECACPLGALAAHKIGKSDFSVDTVGIVSERLRDEGYQLTSLQFAGFTAGFDWDCDAKPRDPFDSAVNDREAFDFGQKCRSELMVPLRRAIEARENATN